MPDGSVKHLHVVAHAVRQEPGNVEFIGAVMDVTAQERTEEALQRSEAYLAEAQRLSHTGSFAYNPGSRKTLYWSEELFRIFGLDPQRGIPDHNEIPSTCASRRSRQGFRRAAWRDSVRKLLFRKITGCCCTMGLSSTFT